MRVERTEGRTAIQLPNVPRRLNWVAGQFDGNGHQSCIVEQIGKVDVEDLAKSTWPARREKERARHVTWNAWWQHFDVVLTRHHFRANHTIPQKEPRNQPELTWNCIERTCSQVECWLKIFTTTGAQNICIASHAMFDG